jgi:hypothetical protein
MISQLLFYNAPQTITIDSVNPRSLALTDVHIHGVPIRGAPAELFLTDVEGGAGWTFAPGQKVWARQFNAEQRTQPKIRNTGATLWILGLKTESPGTVIAAEKNARTEVLGGLLYPVGIISDSSPAFSSVDSTESISFATSAYDASRNYRVLVAATRNGKPEQLLPADAPRRANGSIVPLFRS